MQELLQEYAQDVLPEQHVAHQHLPEQLVQHVAQDQHVLIRQVVVVEVQDLLTEVQEVADQAALGEAVVHQDIRHHLILSEEVVVQEDNINVNLSCIHSELITIEN